MKKENNKMISNTINNRNHGLKSQIFITTGQRPADGRTKSGLKKRTI